VGAAARLPVEHDDRVVHAPAMNEYLKVLQWAREHDCPWDSQTRQCDVAFGHLEVLTWLDEHGAPESFTTN